MLKEIYNIKREDIDKEVKDAIKSVEDRLYKTSNWKNEDDIKKLEENYNIKLGIVTQEVYIKGLKDGINLMLEIFCKK